MLEGLKRLFARGSAGSDGTDRELLDWVDSRQFTHRAVPGEGFVIDGQTTGTTGTTAMSVSAETAWRLEWGPSQRPYVPGHELRLRAELGLPSDLQALLLNRSLAEQMERDVFEQYVEGVQTRIDNQTPPEMRWLVMFPKLPGAEMGALRERYVALGSAKRWLAQWLDGPLSLALASQRHDPAVPLVLMIARGRLLLRTALPEPDVKLLQGWLRLFETAVREARRVAAESDSVLAADTSLPSTPPSTWEASAQPDDDDGPR